MWMVMLVGVVLALVGTLRFDKQYGEWMYYGGVLLLLISLIYVLAVVIHQN